MDFITNVFEHGDYLAALVATVASFPLGFVWYHPKTFGTAWMEGVGLSEEKLQQGNMAKIFGVTAVVTFLAALAITFLNKDGDAIGGLKLGIMIGIFFAATTHVMHTLYEQRSTKVIAIGAGHDIVHYALIGLIAGLL